MPHSPYVSTSEKLGGYQSHSQVVTPDLSQTDSCARKRTKDDSQVLSDGDEGNKNAKRSLFPSQDIAKTQPCTYTQDDNVSSEEKEHSQYYIQDTATGCFFHLGRYDTHEILIGRKETNHIVSLDGRVSGEHAKLIFDANLETWKLTPMPSKQCWILIDGVWRIIDSYNKDSGRNDNLKDGSTFRLLYNTQNQKEQNAVGVQFRFSVHRIMACKDPTGSASFDREYLRLLQQIKLNGIEKKNVKGDNWTLPEQVTLRINLKSSERKKLMPMTTLRYMYGGRPAIIEALWYLRGENHIKFLQEHSCKFWDKQAKADGFVGLSYGLLTNYPDNNGNKYNQLERHVIEPLCANRSSRNMVCSLINPHEPTVQQACTTSIQFAVTEGEHLDLTVNQRSSDTLLGLPHDVIIWATILHATTVEVERRSGRILQAGVLYFTIAAGGAHVYTLNRTEFDTLLQRKPISVANAPELLIENLGEYNIFDFAKNYSELVKALPSSTPNEHTPKMLPSIRIRNYMVEDTYGHLKIQQAV